MRKINSLLTGANAQKQDPLSALLTQVNSYQVLQQLWVLAVPELLSQSSFVGQLDHEVLTVYTHNASIATKIKLTSGSLLSQLGKIQKSNPLYKGCKVTGIKVKVQVKSQPSRPEKVVRTLSLDAANSLNRLAERIQNPLLSDRLQRLAKKT